MFVNLIGFDNDQLNYLKEILYLFFIGLYCEHHKRIPYDWKNPAAYLVTVAGLSLWLIQLFKYVGCMMCLALGEFVFAILIVEFLNDELVSIDKLASVKNSRGLMYQKFSEFIRIHTNLKELSGILSRQWNNR